MNTFQNTEKYAEIEKNKELSSSRYSRNSEAFAFRKS